MTQVTQPPTGGGQTSVAEKAQEKAQEVTSQAQEKAQEAKSRLREQLDTRTTQAGEQMTTVAQAVRKTGDQLRNDGNEAHAKYADRAGERIEQLGNYLTGADADRLLRDVEDFGRRRPWALALAGGVVGLLGARFLKSSSRRRYEESLASGNGTSGGSLNRESVPTTAPYQEL